MCNPLRRPAIRAGRSLHKLSVDMSFERTKKRLATHFVTYPVEIPLQIASTTIAGHAQPKNDNGGSKAAVSDRPDQVHDPHRAPLRGGQCIASS